MSKDIVTRLRDRQRELEFWWPDDDPPLTWVGEAADEIERLRAEVEHYKTLYYKQAMEADCES